MAATQHPRILLQLLSTVRGSEELGPCSKQLKHELVLPAGNLTLQSVSENVCSSSLQPRIQVAMRHLQSEWRKIEKSLSESRSNTLAALRP